MTVSLCLISAPIGCACAGLPDFSSYPLQLQLVTFGFVLVSSRPHQPTDASKQEILFYFIGHCLPRYKPISTYVSTSCKPPISICLGHGLSTRKALVHTSPCHFGQPIESLQSLSQEDDSHSTPRGLYLSARGQHNDDDVLKSFLLATIVCLRRGLSPHLAGLQSKMNFTNYMQRWISSKYASEKGVVVPDLHRTPVVRYRA